MSSNWSQEGPPQMRGNQMQQSSMPGRRGTNPPPVCFNCGGEHFLVDCPSSRMGNTSNTAFAPPSVPYQQAPGPATPSQQFPQNGPSQYPPYAPNQQYVPPASQYQYNQPAQSYTAPAPPTPAPYVAPPSNPQYTRPGYQAPPYSQVNGAAQYSAPAYQPPNSQYNARGPSPYQAPAGNYQPQNNGYRGGYQSAPTSGPYHPPPPQWNNTPFASQAYPKPPRNNGNFQRAFSGTPSNNSQQQQNRQSSRSQSLQLEHSIKTPQTPSSHGVQASPPKPAIKSVASTPASFSDTITVAAPEPEAKVSSEKGKAKEILEQETEEGEVCEGDDEQELFDWELLKIFNSPPPAETVALAQPLSAGYESTPVPLVQAWTTSIPSISRYARKDNLKEFIKSVRVAPQWSYLQEDPAFAELNDDGESIPLDKIGVWMDFHHGRELVTNRTEVLDEAEELEPISKKRSRGESDVGEQENQQEDVDQQIALEAATEVKDEEPPNKRQKNEDADDYDVLMLQSSGGRTPVIIGRGGTPCLAAIDDAWAPQPGETATSPGDPTENLLASLGVSGDPKPRKQASLPPKEKQSSSPPQLQTQASIPSKPQFQGPNSQAPGLNAQNGPQHIGRPMGQGPQNDAQYGPPAMPYMNGNTPNGTYGQGPPSNASQVPPHGYQGYGPGQTQGYAQDYPQGPPQGNPQYGPAMNGPVMNGPAMNGPPMNAPYENGPPQNIHGAPQYGPPVNTRNNGPPNNYQQGPQQWGPQRIPSFGTAPPYAAPPYPQYGPAQNPGYGNVGYGPVANQYQGGTPAQYPQGPPQYNQARHPSYGNGPPMAGQYGPMAQNSPIQYGPQYGQAPIGPPQNVPYNAGQYPNQPQYHNGPVNGYGNGPPQGPPNNVPYANMPHNPNMPPNQMQNGNISNGFGPPRQDSGYVSARGSYSNGSAPNGFNNQSTPQNQAQPPHPQPPQGQPFSDATNQQSPQSGRKVKAEKSVKTLQSMNAEKKSVKMERSATSDASLASATSNENASSPETPLSPTSALILEDLGEPRKSKKANPSKPTRASLSRAVKKTPQGPQPVVQEAYSRRW